MKFNLLFLLPLALSVSAGLVDRGYGGYYTTECPTVTEVVTTTATSTTTATTTATTTTTCTETVTVTSCKKYGYPEATYYAS